MNIYSKITRRLFKSKSLLSSLHVPNFKIGNVVTRPLVSYVSDSVSINPFALLATTSSSSSHNAANATMISASVMIALGLTNSAVQCEQHQQEHNHKRVSTFESSPSQQFIQELLDDAKQQNRLHSYQHRQQKQQQNEQQMLLTLQSQFHSRHPEVSVTIQATSSKVDADTGSNSEYSHLPHLTSIRRGRGSMLLANSEQRSSSSQQQVDVDTKNENEQHNQHRYEDGTLEQINGSTSPILPLLLEKREEQQGHRPLTVQATSAISSGEPMLVERKSKPNDSDGIGDTEVEGVLPDGSNMSIAEATLEEAVRKAKQHSGGLKIFSGNGNMSLALDICRHLGVNLGKATVGRFADGEVNVVIQENVRGKDVYVVQPTGPPVNDNIMELLLMVSTLRRSSARRITVVIPYYGYARQDRKMQARVPISAADVARLMEAMGVDRVIAVDLHCGQIQGFFGPRVPVDNLDGGVVGLDYFACKDLHNPVIVSPDAGGVYRAKNFKEGLEHKYGIHDLSLAMIVKQRAKAGVVDSMDLVGDVRDCDCIIVDDMIDTAGTLCKAADVLLANGARRVFAFASHGLLSGAGNTRIANSSLEEVVVLNTLPTSPQREANAKLTELNVAPLLSRAIFNIHAKKSISALFR